MKLKKNDTINIDLSTYQDAKLSNEIIRTIDLYSPINYILIVISIFFIVLIVPILLIEFSWIKVVLLLAITLIPSFIIGTTGVLLYVLKSLKKRLLNIVQLIVEKFSKILKTELESDNDKMNLSFIENILKAVILQMFVPVIIIKIKAIPLVGGFLGKLSEKNVNRIISKIQLPKVNLQTSSLEQIILKTEKVLVKTINTGLSSMINLVTTIFIIAICLNMVIIALFRI
jgi:hypothetical protein